MFEFLVGLMAGGVIGVVCDRLWQKVEKRIRLRISGGFSDGIEGEAIWFKVKNLGREELPPIRLSLFASENGSYYIFPAACAESAREELWPGQEREFRCTVTPNQDPRLGLGPMLNAVAEMANNPSVVFRVQPVDGDTVIFSNHRIGRAVARLFAAQVDGPGMGHIGGLWGDLNYERRGPIGWLRHKLYIRSLLREAANAEKEARQIPQS